MERELKKLGFSTEEAHVYLALLQFGITTAGPVIKETSLHRQTVYDTLARLEKRKLVSVTVKANRKNFMASDPSKIMDAIESQQALARTIVPELLSMQHGNADAADVTVYEGIEGFRTLHQNNLKSQPKGTNVPTVGALSREWVEAMQASGFGEDFEEERKKKNINVHAVVYESKKGEVESAPGEKRYVSDQYASPIALELWHKSVVMIVYGVTPLLIEIKNDTAVKNFSTYFDMLWRSAKV